MVFQFSAETKILHSLHTRQQNAFPTILLKLVYGEKRLNLVFLGSSPFREKECTAASYFQSIFVKMSLRWLLRKTELF